MHDLGIDIDNDDFKLLLPPGDIVIENGTVNDYSPSGNDGSTTSATQTLTPWGRGLSFDGVDDYVDFGEPSEMEGVPLSILAWMQHPFAPDSSVSTVIFTRRGVWGRSLFLSGSMLRTYVQADTAIVASVSSPKLVPGTWNFLALTITAGMVPRLYINGEEVVYNTQQTGSGDLADKSGDEWEWGDASSGTGEPFNGKGGGLAFLDRVLTATEIQNISRATKPHTSRVMHCTPVAAGIEDTDCKLAIDFNGDVDDRSPAGVSTTRNGMTYEAGVQGQAGHFDGSDDKITVTNPFTIGTDDYLFMVWVRVNDSPADKEVVIGKESLQVWIDADDKLDMYIADGSGNSRLVSCGEVAAGGWHHVAFYHDYSAATYAYLDGVQVDSDNTAFASAIDEVADLYISTKEGSTRWWDGDADRVRVYQDITQAKAESIIAAEVEANYPR